MSHAPGDLNEPGFTDAAMQRVIERAIESVMTNIGTTNTIARIAAQVNSAIVSRLDAAIVHKIEDRILEGVISRLRIRVDLDDER